jgi:hypothetical protein
MLYRNGEYTSLELRDWWLKTLRGLIPEDGYLQICCNISSMSPFVVRYADNVRCGVDIGKGNNWQSQIDNSSWLSAESLFAPGRMWLANTDAIGSMKLMDTAKRHSWLTFCGMTGSAVELGGDLRKESPEDWQDAQRILAGEQIGCAFRPLDFGKPLDPIPSTLWWSEGGISEEPGERPVGMLAAFNWNGEGISRSSVPFSMLGLTGGTYRAVNFWTGEEHIVRGEVEIPIVPDKDVWAVQLFHVE